eukprot:TRINITY_DN29282_c0_g1_i2.p1 TRINITY_DN29282_c0_g1~~TRINITY_DN29282_c0_g1_i2.p1  ORF type:complete len:149 (+),score=24.21 TRINITY_DN29282_c0_g1_i2:184-630(+)
MCIRDRNKPKPVPGHGAVAVDNTQAHTDTLGPGQRHLLKLIKTKIYERSYNLTQVFRGFNDGRNGCAGFLPAEKVVNGLRKMINLGEGNSKLDADLQGLVALCTTDSGSGGQVTYEHFSTIFKIDDQQNNPLLEGLSLIHISEPTRPY